MKIVKILFVLTAVLCLINFSYGQNVFPANGNVGIGTNSPSQALQVHSATHSFIQVSGGAPGIQFTPSSGFNLATAAIGLSTSSTNDQYMAGANNGDLSIRGSLGGRILFGSLNNTQNGTIRMFIKNDGKVNIGPGTEVDPNARLNVEGSIFSAHAIRTSSVKLDPNKGKLKLRVSDAGDIIFKTALAPSPTVVTELQINPDSEFTSGTRVKGPQLTIDGVVGIGTSNTQGYALAVDGKIIAEELKVSLSGNWPDYVFEEGYDLKPLSVVKQEIAEKGHLSGIPSAKEVEKEGFNVSEINAKLLEKVEELTLYLIELDEKVKMLEAAQK